MDFAESIFGPKEEEEAGNQVLDDSIKSAPVTKIISVILRHAIEGRASDIHIEPVADESRVRYRIDGILHTTIKLPIYVHAALVARIKVMSNLKLDETRAPQDGRIRLSVHKKDVDFRISTIPLIGQEKVVMRILSTPDKAPSLQDLGFMGVQLKLAEENIDKPNGMFLVTGPTGSGKSTTLYAILDRLNREEINITTLEDPVEYFVKGVNQSQIRPEVGFTFASGLRSLLRQDPDIMMVGEIRDNETAGLAIQSGLTGHFVLSTLHTNSAIGAVPRLFDMKVEPFLLSSTLNLIIAQRLVRKICENCREEAKIPLDVEGKISEKISSIPEGGFYGGLKKDDPQKWYKGKGCSRCGDTGYKGRVAIVETINVNRYMRELIANGFHNDLVMKELQRQNYITMEQDGIIKALLGITTVEEVLRASESEL
jgi:type IV pilus assembly protein PilB